MYCSAVPVPPFGGGSPGPILMITTSRAAIGNATDTIAAQMASDMKLKIPLSTFMAPSGESTHWSSDHADHLPLTVSPNPADRSVFPPLSPGEPTFSLLPVPGVLPPHCAAPDSQRGTRICRSLLKRGADPGRLVSRPSRVAMMRSTRWRISRSLSARYFLRIGTISRGIFSRR